VARGALAVERLGLGERLRVDRQRGVKAVLGKRDPFEIELDQFALCDPAGAHGLLELGDRLLDDVESRRPGL